jgi:hypothetical protein
MNFCKYKNILGEPNKGIHSLRIGKGVIGDNGVAVFDIFLTIVLSWIFSKIFNLSFLMGLFLSILLGIILHRVFCVRTTIDKILF